jgi:hypothetical protein
MQCALLLMETRRRRREIKDVEEIITRRERE